MKKCSAPSPFCECPDCFHAKHSAPPVASGDLFRVGQWVRVVNWCSKPWIEGPIVSLGTKDSDDLKVRVIRGSTFHRGRVFTMPRKNATPLNDQTLPPP